jgi:hypothetical protein
VFSTCRCGFPAKPRVSCLREDGPIAHRIMRELLPDRLTVRRTPEGVRVTGQASVGSLLALVLRGELVAPGGFEPPSQP